MPSKSAPTAEELPPELERLGCTWSSTPHEFWTACSGRLSPNGKYDDLCQDMADDMVEQHGIMSVAQMTELYRHQWTDMLGKHGAKPGWVDTFMRILNTEFKVMCNDKTAIPEAALKMQLQAEHKKNSFKEARFGKQWSNLGEALKARGELDSVSLPASVFEAPYECPDVSAFNLSYNDTKAVTKEIFLWVLKKFNTVYIDKTFALHVEKLLLAAGIKHYKGERWWKVIVDRFENGRRSHAKV